jgi:hypothetical protein
MKLLNLSKSEQIELEMLNAALSSARCYKDASLEGFARATLDAWVSSSRAEERSKIYKSFHDVNYK